MSRHKPTVEWRAHLERYADQKIYTIEAIAHVDGLLEDYEQRLQHIETRDRDTILAEVKQVILSLNSACDLYPGMIETREREELCEFIEGCAVDVGLQLNFREDITEQWRKW